MGRGFDVEGRANVVARSLTRAPDGLSEVGQGSAGRVKWDYSRMILTIPL